MAKDEYKKRCRKCKYHTTISTPKGGATTVCYYIAMTQQLRGCPATECDKFEQRRRGKKT